MRRIFTNIASNWVLLVANVIVALFLVPVLLNRLGREAYGIIVLVNTIAAYVNLLRGGLGGAVVQKVAAARGRGDAQEASRVASGVFTLYVLMGLVAALIGAVIAWNVPRFFQVPEALQDQTRGFALLTVALIASQFPGSVFGGILQALERYDRLNIALGIGLVARTTAILLLVKAPEHLMRLGWIQLTVALGSMALAAVLARITWPGVRVGLASPLDPSTRKAARFGLKNLSLNVAEKVIYDTDPVVIGSTLGPGPVGTYNVGSTIANHTRKLQGELARVLGPTMSRLASGGDEAEQRKTYLVMTRTSLLLALPIVGFGIAIASKFIHLWVGPGFEQAATVMQILLIPQLFTAPQSVAVSLLWGRDRLKLPVLLFLSEALLNLGLSLWWVQLWDLRGVALGTLVPVILLNSLWLPRAAARTLGLRFSDVWRGSLRGPCILVPGVALMAWALATLVPTSWPALLAALAGATVAYGALALRWGLQPEERGALASALGRKSRSSRAV